MHPPPLPAGRPASAARRAPRRRRARRATPGGGPRRSPSGSSAPMPAARSGSVRRSDTARARRSSSGASSRKAYGLALRISCDIGDGAAVSTATVRMAPDSMRSSTVAQAVDVHRLVQAVVERLVDQRMVGRLDRADLVVAAGELGGEDGGEQILGAHALQRHRHACGRRLKRSSASARVAFQRQRLPNIGATSAACTRSSRNACERTMPKTLSSGKLCCSPSDRTMPSSVAAACSSKSKLTQKRLRSARPKARLMRPPNGACRTSCMPPAFVEEALGDDRVERRHGAERRQRAARRSGRSARRRRRRRAPRSSASAPRRRARGARTATSRRRSATAADSSGVRAGASPSQNGIVGGAPAASTTRTRPASTRRMRQERLPSRKMSPAMLSMAKSSFTLPTDARWSAPR